MFVGPLSTGRWQLIRLPFSRFGPEIRDEDAFPLDVNNIERVCIRYEVGWCNKRLVSPLQLFSS